MSADEAALVRAVLGDPRDALARSVYADWLEEQGMGVLAGAARSGVLAAERRESIKAALEADFGDAMRHLDFERGLLTLIVTVRSFRTRAFERRTPALLRKHGVARLLLFGQASDWSRIGASPVLAGLHAFSLDACQLGDDGVAALARGDGMQRLACLSLFNTGLGERGFVAVAEAEAWPRLVALDLGFNRPGERGLRALAAGLPAGLRHLSLRGTGLDEAAVAVLAGSPRAAGLASLDLANNWLGDPVIEVLASSPHLAALRSLNFHNSRIGDAGCDALARTGLLGRLHWLSLASNQLSPEGTLRLARAVADLPACRLVLERFERPPAQVAELAAILGDRLILE